MKNEYFICLGASKLGLKGAELQTWATDQVEREIKLLDADAKVKDNQFKNDSAHRSH